MRLSLAGLAITVVALGGAVPAHADGLTYRGGCSFGTLNDTTPGGMFGGPDTWRGYARLAVVPTAPSGLPSGGTVTAWCSLRINGADQAPMLGPVTGTGAVVAAGYFEFEAAITDFVEVCTHVTTASGTEERCGLDDPYPPQIVNDLIDAIVAVYNLLPWNEIDATDCPLFVAVAPTVNTVAPGLLYIDPAQGDVYLGGTTAGDLIYDCPPYVVT